MMSLGKHMNTNLEWHMRRIHSAIFELSLLVMGKTTVKRIIPGNLRKK